MDYRIEHVCRALTNDPSLTLDQLAQMVNLSHSRLQHLFKPAMGKSLGSYAMELRLEKATRLLAETDTAIKQIRIKVGIRDRSNFVRYFKQRFSTTPAVFRREVRKRRSAASTNK